MDKKQIKRVVKKNVKRAEVKGVAIKKAVKKNVKKVEKKSADLEAYAMKEYAKIKKQMDVTAAKVESYVKKNPEKVAAISAGIGMALGAVAGVLAGRSSNSKKKK